MALTNAERQARHRARVKQRLKAAEAGPQDRYVTLRDIIYQNVPFYPDPDTPEWDDRKDTLDTLIAHILPWLLGEFYYRGGGTTQAQCHNPAAVDAISAVVGVDLRAIIDAREQERLVKEEARQARRERRHRKKAA